mmetsp:Transcript_88105/g.254169  ORF Transcript_88105/g.254169 Transcript_88105/m.254169 type:complete len:249 (-) Transcript_88105:261-1007(-)
MGLLVCIRGDFDRTLRHALVLCKNRLLHLDLVCMRAKLRAGLPCGALLLLLLALAGRKPIVFGAGARFAQRGLRIILLDRQSRRGQRSGSAGRLIAATGGVLLRDDPALLAVARAGVSCRRLRIGPRLRPQGGEAVGRHGLGGSRRRGLSDLSRLPTLLFVRFFATMKQLLHAPLRCGVDVELSLHLHPLLLEGAQPLAGLECAAALAPLAIVEPGVLLAAEGTFVYLRSAPAPLLPRVAALARRMVV